MPLLVYYLYNIHKFTLKENPYLYPYMQIYPSLINKKLIYESNVHPNLGMEFVNKLYKKEEDITFISQLIHSSYSGYLY